MANTTASYKFPTDQKHVYVKKYTHSSLVPFRTVASREPHLNAILFIAVTKVTRVSRRQYGRSRETRQTAIVLFLFLFCSTTRVNNFFDQCILQHLYMDFLSVKTDHLINIPRSCFAHLNALHLTRYRCVAVWRKAVTIHSCLSLVSSDNSYRHYVHYIIRELNKVIGIF